MAASFRTIKVDMWRNDEWFPDLEPDAKLVWIWMQTNEHSLQPWQLKSITEIANATGVSCRRASEIFDQFVNDQRVEVDGDGRFRIFTSHIRCAKCGAGFDITKDHVTPSSRGGRNEPGNLQWLCRSCNSSKGNRHVIRY